MLKIRCAFISQFFVTIYKGKNRTFFSLEKKKKKRKRTPHLSQINVEYVSGGYEGAKCLSNG